MSFFYRSRVIKLLVANTSIYLLFIKILFLAFLYWQVANNILNHWIYYFYTWTYYLSIVLLYYYLSSGFPLYPQGLNTLTNKHVELGLGKARISGKCCASLPEQSACRKFCLFLVPMAKAEEDLIVEMIPPGWIKNAKIK